ncbi:MAG: ABC transporter permease [Asticcacaulis sp.]
MSKAALQTFHALTVRLGLVVQLVRSGLALHWGAASLSVLIGSLSLSLLLLVGMVKNQGINSLTQSVGEVDVVIGPRGSERDMVLCCALHLTEPKGLIPTDIAMDLTRSPFLAASAPIALGDSYAGTRIVWTTPSILAVYMAELDQGHMWTGPMQAVLGAEAARHHGLKPGDHFDGVHGFSSPNRPDETDPHGRYVVTGVLKSTQSRLDYMILADWTSVGRVHEVPGKPHTHGPHHNHDKHHAGSHVHHTAQDAPPSLITAVVGRFRSPLAAGLYPQRVQVEDQRLNHGLRAAVPATETAQAMRFFRPGLEGLQALGTLTGVIAGLMAAASLSQTLLLRQRDLALLDCLGAGVILRVGVVVAEAMILAVAALTGGVLITAGVLALAQPSLAAQGLYVTILPDLPLFGGLALASGLVALVSAVLPLLICRTGTSGADRLTALV